MKKAVFDDRKLAQNALAAIVRLVRKRSGITNIMEVCGTHTMAIAASGIRRLLPKGLKLLSGPGCPVCVTACGDIDRAMEMACLADVILATFGDMVKVRGSRRSLDECRVSGADIRIVYSPLDAVETAKQNPGKKVVFLGVGFETTAPAVSAAVLHAKAQGVNNFFVLSLFKLVPPALGAILSDPDHRIHGFLLPGHVSTIIGAVPYKFIADEYRIPCVIAGFEPLDILCGLNMILAQMEKGEAQVEIEYSRTVKAGGNPSALKVLWKVFEISAARWRSFGNVPSSGLAFKKEYSIFDAEKHFSIPYREIPEPKGCLCAQVLMGKAQPKDCKLFSKACTPSNAVGPCMVSSEGACAAWYKYGSG